MLAASFGFNILSATFTVLSMVMLIPVLNILFQEDQEVLDMVPWAFDASAIEHNFYYLITQFKLEYGPGAALLFSSIFMVTGTFFKCATAYLAEYTNIGLRNNIIRDIRNEVYTKIISLPLGFFQQKQKGDVLQIATGDVAEIERTVMSSINMFLKNPVIIIVLLGSMIYISPTLTLFVFILLPIAGGIIGKIGKNLKVRSLEGQNKMGELMSIIDETLSGLRIVKAFNAEEKMDNRYGRESQNYCDIAKRIARRWDLAHPVSEFLGTIVMIILVWFGGTLILTKGEEALSVSVFLTYIGIFYQIINPAKDFSRAYYTIQKGMAAMERIDKILLAPDKIFENTDGKDIKEFKTGIEYKNVTFSYNGERDVLKNVSMTIPKGKMVALVGQSGSGKSTFVDLLPRFWDISQGEILIDGINIKDYKLCDLRGLMGNVNQEAILFNDTIYNNIAFGVEHATQEEVETAAKIANAHSFILEQDNGYETVIGDRGSKLSGGQRQRISIARAVLRNPDILILDEATSALDTESERLVQEALEKLLKGRTSLVVAHRLSTIRNADMICVFNEGEIVEVGTHDELIQRENGVYKKLHDLQQLK
ncbi:MAG: ABC transporter ATP-binding protein [Bacteroidia bacterium]|nr:ABC transporter ATP-binding protein [Bacteroidia bacterium]